MNGEKANVLMTSLSIHERSSSSPKTAIGSTMPNLLKRGKNRQRHCSCLTTFRPTTSSKLMATRSRDKMDAFIGNRNDAKEVGRMWEKRVLSQLSEETANFIKDRFKH